MTSLPNSILEDREQRVAWVKSFLSPGKTVVTLHANIPGPDKKVKEAYVILGIVATVLDLGNVVENAFHDGFDGPCYLYVIDEPDSDAIKHKAEEFEQSHPLGRFIDLDVFKEHYHSLNRKEPRLCYLCQKPAFLCAKAQTHPLSELLSFITEKTAFFLRDQMEKIIDSSIMDELLLDPKFGLVTPTSRGSHPDMDYDLMIDAKNAILSHFESMFFIGFFGNDPDRIFEKIRRFGLFAEQAMLEATKGINAYKGLIFSLGLVCAGSGYVMANHLPFKDIFTTVEYMTKDLINELKSEKGTFGLEAYERYQFGGARMEAYKGFPAVKKVLPLLDSITEEKLMKTLLELIQLTEDTVLLKRSGSLEQMKKVQEKLRTVDANDPESIAEITRWCIEHDLSFGGAADLLVVTSFLRRLSSFFKFPE